MNKIIVIEDNEGDLTLIKKAFNEKINFTIDLTVFKDGEEALSYLSELDDNVDDLPHLILLDLNLPKVNGLTILKSLKSNKITMKIPVVVFSSSTLSSDVMDVYNSNGNAYVTKPMELDQYLNAIRSINDFWLDVAHFPEEFND